MNIVTFLKNSKKVLGMNARTLEYIEPWNRTFAWRVADNKLLTKKILDKAGIAVPKTYAVIESPWSLKSFDCGTLPRSFALKPNRGLGGEGILITYKRRENGAWLDSDLKEKHWHDIKAHEEEILDGRFSLSDMPDIAFFEERLVRESMFKPLVYRGVPDFRIIVYNHVPIMAEMRLPTHESHGRANLHLGGIGVGVDIASGITTHAICHDKLFLDRNLSGIKIPEWDAVLALALQAQQVVRLGFMGVDIVLAKNRGPVVLELNARPGLSIQNANMTGLRDRMMRVRGLKVESIEHGINLAKHLFGTIGGEFGKRAVVGVVERVSLYHKLDQGMVTIQAKIDSGAQTSSLDYEVARKIGYGDLVDYLKSLLTDRPMTKLEAKKLERKFKSELNSHPEIKSVKLVNSASGSTVRVTVPVRFLLKGTRIDADVNLISRKHLTYDMIVGRQDMSGFLINLEK